MEGAIWTFITMALGGMAVLAFKHPENFARLHPIIALISSIGMVGSTMYWIGVNNAERAIISVVTEYPQEARSAVAGLQASSDYVWYGSIFFALYSTVLYWLPSIIGTPSSKP